MTKAKRPDYVACNGLSNNGQHRPRSAPLLLGPRRARRWLDSHEHTARMCVTSWYGTRRSAASSFSHRQAGPPRLDVLRVGRSDGSLSRNPQPPLRPSSQATAGVLRLEVAAATSCVALA
jgi:hypothetical protein